ncbi:glyoxalase [Pseudomonas sp. 1D4]|uniref:VOC family protein n=1 Tax=Pseudomonadaceae TaxID=135621 RepID=UPI00084AF8F6|nr:MULTISPECIES: VOC family protein [Pseudomonas]OEC44080.1 glyoxalase [Pseudomonas sp. 1D4]OEC59770.1 glyoxalase [Pseudomonas sp. ENNP23]
MESNPSILSHISLGSNDFDRAVAFYDRVLATLGCRRVLEHPGAVAYGREYPEFWIQRPFNGAPASVGNGTHIGFFAPDREAVDAFYKAAVAAGARPDGAPGPREEYGAPYYGCFVRDLDGHKVEATFWDLSQDFELVVD